MNQWPPSQDLYPERLNRVRELIAAGDDAALAAELADLAVANGDVWRFDGAQVRLALEKEPPARRHALVLAVGERATAPVSELLRMLAHGIGADVLTWPAARLLIDGAGTCNVFPWLDELTLLAEFAERETGALPPGLVAVMRRTAHFRHDRERLRPWLDRQTGLLNAGEAWAETADADAAGRALLTHALAATGPRPAATWTRAAAMVTVGDWKPRVHDWLARVPSPRTIALRVNTLYDLNALLDPYNAQALRGLLHLLSVTPEHVDDAAVIGGLAAYTMEKVPGHGPRDQMIANAAIAALGRLASDPARSELERLRAATRQPGMIKRLDAAMPRRHVS
ncbi:hypothetical protein Ait01nite_024710 [Actinoplanes italicus]|uniref:Uncharacterized protein n=1 Tax=Actinoplanes italicus TaxID=113567 RepID=A0A2T0KFK7_9ACTN|nr:hypothetical protein [Actinoplanes italicus]PRX22155.1 hypothetical protein CLV67_105332 [Actinoplanes italicus]GIE29426.1 hypothetical protein Ait01nite_024710 [Actinoplanes italicus]